MEERIIYCKCIDFRKKAITAYDLEVLHQDQLLYLSFSLMQLKQLKKEYVEKQKILNHKIQTMYLRADKTKQRFCVYSQKEQEKLRSLKWFYIRSIEYLEQLIAERGE